MFIDDALIYFASFFAIWWGSGLIMSAVDHFSRRLKISSFAISFFVLGLLTSVPEFAIGMTSVVRKDPEIFVGNLLGGIAIMFLFVIPLLAILGKGIKFSHEFKGSSIVFSLAIAVMPAFFVLDRKVSTLEGWILIGAYGILFYLIQKDKGIFDQSHNHVMELKSYSLIDILKVILGIGIVFISSQVIVEKTILFSGMLHISEFLISLTLLSIGTNLPEISLAVRSAISGKKDIAFGDYIGSAAANTFLFGIFTLLNRGEVLTVNNFLTTFLCLVIGLGIFYEFSRSKHALSRKEGMVLILLYGVFFIVEWLRI
ncbi:MAG: hypothetical protein Q7S61_04880 [bacterium]|nr:hypothetical protein [bacterium]